MDLVAMIEAADKLRSEIVLCFKGQPGIGKTQAVYEFARKHDRSVVEIIASQILPNEVSGITMPDKDTKSMEVFDHARLSSLKDGDILFFDELLQAAPSTLSACLTLIQERRLMSGRKLPDVLIIAACNPLASAKMIPLSIRQRFMFIDVSWNSYEWRDYIKDRFGVEPTNILLNQIQSSMANQSMDYNVLTPRTATKLLQWLIATDCDDEVVSAIASMFDGDVAQALIATTKNTDKLREIKTFVAKEFDFTEVLSATTVEELMEILRNDERWEKIAEALAKQNL